MNRFYELDKSITREVMQEFKGQTVDSICPDCKGETSPKVGEVVLYKYTHHLNRRSTMEIIKEGIMVGIGSKKKMFLADHPERIGIVKFNGNKTNSRVLFRKLQKKYKCERCEGSGSYKIQY